MKIGKHSIEPSIGLAVTAAGWATVAGGAIWLGVWAAFGDSIPRLGIINAFGWPIAVVLLLAAFVLMFRRSWLVAGLGFVLGVTIAFQGVGLNPSAIGASETAEDATRIVSASLRTHNTDMVSAAREVAAHNPDIVALQEVSDLTAFKAELEQVTGSHWNAVTDRNFATLSRNPVREGADNQRNWVSSEVRVGGKWISIWNLHAPKNFARPGTNSAYFVELVDAINARDPDIVLGDFNATPWNFGYGAVERVLDNAHREAGFGPGVTFPARGRMLGIFGATSRIDHIFYDPKHSATYATTGRASPDSDHHPVIADIRFR